MTDLTGDNGENGEEEEEFLQKIAKETKDSEFGGNREEGRIFTEDSEGNEGFRIRNLNRR
jgi:hypothetical protein